MNSSKGKVLDTGLTSEKVRELFGQGLGDFVSAYDERVKLRAEGTSMSDHWGHIPDRINVGTSTYTPQELLEHFRQGDDIGNQILEIMKEYFMNSRAAYVAAICIAGHIEKKKPTVRVFAGTEEMDPEQMIRDVRSLDLKVNSILAMAVYAAVKILYLKPEERKDYLLQ